MSVPPIDNQISSNDNVITNGSSASQPQPQAQPVAGPSRVYQQPSSTTAEPNGVAQVEAGPSRPSESNGNAHAQSSDTKPIPPPTPTPTPTLSQIDREAIGRKRKWSSLGYSTEEQESMERTTTAYHYALAQDQFSTLFPDPPTKFGSYDDMVGRLVPYHIWQTCDEELEGYVGEDESRRKAREEKERKEASELLTRMTKINQRFMNLRTLDAQKSSPTVDLIYMIKESTAVLREELSTVQARLRSATAEHNALEWEEKTRLQKVRQAEVQRREAEERRIAAMVAASTKHGQSSTQAPTPGPIPTAKPYASGSTPALGTAAKPSFSTPAPAPVPAPASVAGPAHTPLFELKSGRPKHVQPTAKASVPVAVQAPAATPTPTSKTGPATTPVPPQSALPALAPIVQSTPTRGRGRPRKSIDPISPQTSTAVPNSSKTNGTGTSASAPDVSVNANANAPASSSDIDAARPDSTSTSQTQTVSSSAALRASAPAPAPLPTSVSASASASSVNTPGLTVPITTSSQAPTPSSGVRATRSNPAPGQGPASVPGNGSAPAPPAGVRPGPMKGPVSITVPIASVPDLLRAEVLSRDPEGIPRAPASIARKAEDKKSVVLSIDLSRCSPKQLLALAKILKVDTASNGGARDAVAQVAEGS